MSQTTIIPNPYENLAKRLGKIKAKAKPLKPNGDCKNQTLNNGSNNQSGFAESPVRTRAPIVSDRFQKTVQIAPTRAAAIFSAETRLTAQQYADEAAREHASTAGWLITQTIADMRIAIGVLSGGMAFAEPKEIPKLAEGYATCTQQIRRALGLRDDIEIGASRSLVQIQCIGQVQVSEAHAPMTIELPDVDFE